MATNRPTGVRHTWTRDEEARLLSLSRSSEMLSEAVDAAYVELAMTRHAVYSKLYELWCRGRAPWLRCSRRREGELSPAFRHAAYLLARAARSSGVSEITFLIPARGAAELETAGAVSALLVLEPEAGSFEEATTALVECGREEGEKCCHPECIEYRATAARAAAIEWTPSVTLAVGDVVTHPRFGIGRVTMVGASRSADRAGGRAEVVFRDGAKVLVCGGGPSPARLARVLAATPARLPPDEEAP